MDDADNQRKGVRSWLPLAGIVLAIFILNTSEFMPMALMTDISADLGVSESSAGMLITAYAWVVAILALPLMIALNRVRYRLLITATLSLFVGLQVLSAVSPDYWVLMLSRIGVACTHAVLFSLAAPLAVRVVPEEHRAKAIGAVAAATSLAVILGLPLGRTVGLLFGWRMTFVLVAVLGAVALAILAATFPKLANEGSGSLRGTTAVFRNGTLACLYAVAVLVLVGHYVGYSYIEPFLGQVAAMDENVITLILTVFGIAGLAGTFVFARCYAAHRYAFNAVMLTCMTASLLLMAPLARSTAAEFVIFAVWGMFITAFITVAQAEVISNSPEEHSAVAMSALVALMNAGAGIGTMFGGVVTDGIGIGDIGYVGGAILLAGTVLCVTVLFRLMRRSERSPA